MIAEIQEFAEAAKRTGCAEPSEVDAYLREGSNAFLAKNYTAAFQIFRALLIPAGHGEFHLGQDELIDEVAGVDPATCAAQHVVSMYMTATPKNRGKAELVSDREYARGDFLDGAALATQELGQKDLPPRLATPEVADLIRLADVRAPSDAATREANIKAMHTAAEKRISGVTENKRRRHYGHTASLALACAQVDGPATGTRWLDDIRDEYRRYPALQRGLGRRRGRA